MRGKIFILILLTCCLYSCIKPPSYPTIPHITFISASPAIIQSGSVDSITFSFTDGTGQIGITSTATDSDSLCGLQDGDSSELHSPAHNVFLIDTRTNCISPFASGTVTTTGKYKGISGNIFVLQNVYSDKCLVPSATCPNDTVIYAIVIKDEAGNLSNFIETTPIVILNQ